jgi:hypothetical protein
MHWVELVSYPWHTRLLVRNRIDRGKRVNPVNPGGRWKRRRAGEGGVRNPSGRRRFAHGGGPSVRLTLPRRRRGGVPFPALTPAAVPGFPYNHGWCGHAPTNRVSFGFGPAYRRARVQAYWRQVRLRGSSGRRGHCRPGESLPGGPGSGNGSPGNPAVQAGGVLGGPRRPARRRPELIEGELTRPRGERASGSLP